MDIYEIPPTHELAKIFGRDGDGMRAAADRFLVGEDRQHRFWPVFLRPEWTVFAAIPERLGCGEGQ